MDPFSLLSSIISKFTGIQSGLDAVAGSEKCAVELKKTLEQAANVLNKALKGINIADADYLNGMLKEVKICAEQMLLVVKHTEKDKAAFMNKAGADRVKLKDSMLNLQRTISATLKALDVKAVSDDVAEIKQPLQGQAAAQNTPTGATLIVKASLVNEGLTSKIDDEVAKPAGLNNVEHNYHVTLGFVENVPREQAGSFKEEIHKYLQEQVHPIKVKPLEFNVKRATTFRLLGSLNYSGKEVILFPREDSRRMFVEMNEKLSDFVVQTAKTRKDFSQMEMSKETRTYRYIPHITMNTPGKMRNSQQLTQNAMDTVNRYFESNPTVLKMNEYRTSVH